MKNTIERNRSQNIRKGFSPVNGGNITYYLYFYVSLILILLLVDVLFQKGVKDILISRAWGLNNFAYFPLWLEAIVFIILFSLAIPYINDKVRLFTQKFTLVLKKKSIGRAGKIIWFFSISLFMSLLFYLLKVKYDLLGDMDLRVSQTVDSKYINDEYLTMYFLHQVNIILQKHLLIPHQTFVLHSVVSGFFYSLLSLLIADLLFNDVISSMVFFLFCISIGTLLVFCGYVEIYAIPVVSVALYIYASLLYLKRKVTILLPFFCLALAVALHLEQMSLIPSFVFLAVGKFKFTEFISSKIILLTALISIPLIYILNAYLKLTSLTPLTKIASLPNVYTVISFKHFWELFNAEYLSSGLYLFLFCSIIIFILRGRIKEDSISLFFLIATIFSFVIVFTANKERGSGDWDICSFPAISLAMFIGYIALTQWNILYSPRKLFYVTSVALVFNTFNCWAWIGINSSKVSLNKIEDMILTDPGYYYNTHLHSEMELALLLRKCGAHDKAIKYYKLSYEKYSSFTPLAVSNYVLALLERGDTNKAIPILEEAIANHPFYFDAYDILFPLYQKKGMNDKVYAYAKGFVATYDTNPKAVLGDPKGENIFERCLVYLSNNSLARNDNLTYQYVQAKIQELNIYKKTVK